MGNGTKFLVTTTATLISNHKRKQAVNKINKENELNKQITDVGRVYAKELISVQEVLGNMCITGGTENGRNILIIQNCEQTLVNQIPTVILHEKNCQLEDEIRQKFAKRCYCKIVNKSEPFYEPLIRLSDQEIGNILVDATKECNLVNAEGASYLEAISCLARKKGISPCLRMISAFPHDKAQQIISGLVAGGNLSPQEASYIRNSLDIDTDEKAKIKNFFSKLVKETEILAGENELGQTSSIAECINRKGILVIDVGTCAKSRLLGLLRAEIENCISEGMAFRLIIDAVSIANSKWMMDVLSKEFSDFWWTISTPDINKFIGGEQKLSSWMGLTHKTIMFANPNSTSKELSKELGDYDFKDISFVHGDGADFGNFGLHFGKNVGIHISMRRELKVKPEEISQLKEREFFGLNNNTAEIIKGVLI